MYKPMMISPMDCFDPGGPWSSALCSRVRVHKVSTRGYVAEVHSPLRNLDPSGGAAPASAAAAADVSLQLSVFAPTLRDPDCLCPCPHIRGDLIEQPAKAPPPRRIHNPNPFGPEPPENTDSCTLSVIRTDNTSTINSSRQRPGWPACWQSPDSASPPCSHKSSGGDKHWPAATSSQLYICHMLMTSSPWPPTDLRAADWEIKSFLLGTPVLFFHSGAQCQDCRGCNPLSWLQVCCQVSGQLWLPSPATNMHVWLSGVLLLADSESKVFVKMSVIIAQTCTFIIVLFVVDVFFFLPVW